MNRPDCQDRSTWKPGESPQPGPDLPARYLRFRETIGAPRLFEKKDIRLASSVAIYERASDADSFYVLRLPHVASVIQNAETVLPNRAIQELLDFLIVYPTTKS